MGNKGKVKWFDKKKGWGYITRDDGQDFFVHYSNIKLLDTDGKEKKGFKTLEANQVVVFETRDDAKGPQAINVVVQ
jgi:CspA family cold shock protein